MGNKLLQGVKTWGPLVLTLVTIIVVLWGGAVAYGRFQGRFSSIEKDLEPLEKLPEVVARLETTETELGKRTTELAAQIKNLEQLNVSVARLDERTAGLEKQISELRGDSVRRLERLENLILQGIGDSKKSSSLLEKFLQGYPSFRVESSGWVLWSAVQTQGILGSVESSWAKVPLPERSERLAQILPPNTQVWLLSPEWSAPRTFTLGELVLLPQKSLFDQILTSPGARLIIIGPR